MLLSTEIVTALYCAYVSADWEPGGVQTTLEEILDRALTFVVEAEEPQQSPQSDEGRRW